MQIVETDFPEIREVDLKLIELARRMSGKIVTNDFNLNKVAQLRGVPVLNINELANSLKPVVLPGELMKVFVIKEGKEAGPGRRLPRRRHHGGGGPGPQGPRQDHRGQRDQRAADHGRQDDLLPLAGGGTVEDPASRNSRVGDRRDPRPARDLRAPERRENERRDGVMPIPPGVPVPAGRIHPSVADGPRTRRSRWTSPSPDLSVDPPAAKAE